MNEVQKSLIRLQQRENVSETGLGSYPMVNFSVSSVEPSGSTATDLLFVCFLVHLMMLCQLHRLYVSTDRMIMTDAIGKCMIVSSHKPFYGAIPALFWRN